MTTPIHQDLDLSFAIHPVKRDLVLKRDEDAVIASIKHLLLTNHYEVPFQPEVGCNIRKLLFENLTPFTASDLSRFIRETIENFEPRAKIHKLLVTPNYDQNGYAVYLECFIGVNPNLQSVDFLLERIR